VSIDGPVDSNSEGLGASQPESVPADTATTQQSSSLAPRLLSIAALVIAVVALVVALMGNRSTQGDSALDATNAASKSDFSANSFFSYPQNIDAIIAKVQASTVTIGCKDFSGSGWVIELGPPDQGDEEAVALDAKYPTEVITNHHVIEQCTNSPRKVTATAGDTTYDAYLYSWDEDNDLALIGIKQKVPALELSKRPVPGWWTMAIGTPYGLEGSISIGNVINHEENAVISTASLNSGNSGGPLVNSRGQVIGTNSWTYIGEEVAQDWNGSINLPTLCEAIVACAKDDPLLWKQ